MKMFDLFCKNKIKFYSKVYIYFVSNLEQFPCNKRFF